VVYDKVNVEIMKKQFSRFCSRLVYSSNLSLTEKLNLLNKMYDETFMYLHHYCAKHCSYNYIKKCYFLTFMKILNIR